MNDSVHSIAKKGSESLLRRHQRRDFGGSQFSDDEDGEGPPHTGLLAIQPTDGATSPKMLFLTVVSKVVSSSSDSFRPAFHFFFSSAAHAHPVFQFLHVTVRTEPGNPNNQHCNGEADGITWQTQPFVCGRW